jgi:hypothetical protein
MYVLVCNGGYDPCRALPTSDYSKLIGIKSTWVQLSVPEECLLYVQNDIMLHGFLLLILSGELRLQAPRSPSAVVLCCSSSLS